jgi:hypothetical protein
MTRPDDQPCCEIEAATLDDDGAAVELVGGLVVVVEGGGRVVELGAVVDEPAVVEDPADELELEPLVVGTASVEEGETAVVSGTVVIAGSEVTELSLTVSGVVTVCGLALRAGALAVEPVALEMPPRARPSPLRLRCSIGLPVAS